MGYNRVFGYYIEVSKGQTDLVPETYIRKQTLANCERYITQELKELENTILYGQGPASARWNTAFSRSCASSWREQAARVQATAAGRGAAGRAALLCRTWQSSTATAGRTVDLSGEIHIHDGRHPVVEQVLKDSLFVPNDTRLWARQGNQVAIITGPNMAGKSTYMRQVALIVLHGADWLLCPGPLGAHRRGGPASLPASARRTTWPPASPPSWWR